MNKPRMLVLASTYPRWVGDTIPNFVHLLNRQLSKRGIQIFALVPHCEHSASYEELDEIKIHRFRYFFERYEVLAYQGGMLNTLTRGLLPKLLLILYLVSQFVHTLTYTVSKKIDLIHAHWVLPQGLVAVLVTKLLFWKKIPIVITVHGGDIYGLNGKFVNLIRNWTFRQAAAITIVSNAIKKELPNLSTVHIRSMGVDAQHLFYPTGEKRKNFILFVGRLAEKKGCEILIRAFKEIHKIHANIDLKIIGDGPLQNELIKLSDELAISTRVHFIGSVPQTELPPWYRTASVFVLPSIVAKSGDQEGLGLVLAEAMACECPVIASNLPAVRDLAVDERFGELVQPSNISELATALNFVLENSSHALSGAKLARKHVLENYDWQVVGEDYYKIVNENIM